MCTASEILWQCCDFVATLSRVGTQDTNQRTTRSQTRSMAAADRCVETSARMSSTARVKQNTAGPTVTLSDRSQLVSHGNIKAARPGSVSSTRSGTVAHPGEAVKAKSTVAQKVPPVSRSGMKQDRPSSHSTISDIAEHPTMQKITGTGKQSKRLKNSAAVQVVSSQKPKSAGCSDHQSAANCTENEDGAGETEGNAIFSGQEAVVVSVESSIVPCDSEQVNEDAGDAQMHDAEVLPHIVDDKSLHNTGSKHVSQPEVTPGRSRRRVSTMASPAVTFASIRKTPKNLRNSLLLRRMSPEEGYMLRFWA